MMALFNHSVRVRKIESACEAWTQRWLKMRDSELVGCTGLRSQRVGVEFGEKIQVGYETNVNNLRKRAYSKTI
jgi:hypothetical protein